MDAKKNEKEKQPPVQATEERCQGVDPGEDHLHTA